MTDIRRVAVTWAVTLFVFIAGTVVSVWGNWEDLTVFGVPPPPALDDLSEIYLLLYLLVGCVLVGPLFGWVSLCRARRHILSRGEIVAFYVAWPCVMLAVSAVILQHAVPLTRHPDRRVGLHPDDGH